MLGDTLFIWWENWLRRTFSSLSTTLTERDWPRWVLIVFGAAASIGVIIAHVVETDQPFDMMVYRAGVQRFFEGGEVYSEPMHVGGIDLPFIYPPFGALIMAPLASRSISDDMAGNIMIVLSNLLILLCFYFIARAVLNQHSKLTHLAVTVGLWPLLLLTEPVRLNNGFAQINIVLMALVVLDLVPRKRYLPQGWLIGIAAAIKVTPLAMLLYFLLRKDIKAILTAFVSLLAATALAAVVRWDMTKEFFGSKLLGMGAGEDFGVGTDYQSNSSIQGVLTRVFTSQDAAQNAEDPTKLIWLLCALATIVVGSWIMNGLLRRGMDVDAWLIGSMVMLLISPVSWSHHWVWLAFILPVFLYRAWQLRTTSWFGGIYTAVVALWSVLVLTVPPKWWFGDHIDVYTQNWYAKFLVNDFVWLAALLWFCVAVSLFFFPEHTHRREATTATTEPANATTASA
ncbi:DUF2029 domain-containing protein [Corynebacterium incognita]|uniref:DUF2029 domain-containing protein n=1 Tax=Corynebacterium incognita TaxID=2754725 RepID=A0A7G7CPC5_9CORY|nr:glycosyltransferase family 87 protein [Corynebacterium incognita]QNE89441.1 DUF2029 domain-containing protein [Corynebacterium incognita]